MREIDGMITELVGTYKIVEDAELLMPPSVEKQESVHPADSMWQRKGYSCENRQCNFVLQKQNRFFEAFGKKMTKQTAIKLLSDGKIALKG